MWPNLRKKTLICYYLWFSTALIYYGLTLNSNTLGTDLFLTFSIGKVGLIFMSKQTNYCLACNKLWVSREISFLKVLFLASRVSINYAGHIPATQNWTKNNFDSVLQAGYKKYSI